MSSIFRSPSLILFGALAMSAACTFDPPGSVLNKGGGGGGGGGGADAGGGAADAGPGGAESMTISFSTTPRGGQYAPTNIIAVWIEDSVGNMVETIDRKSAIRTESLRAWGAKAPVPPVDVTSGATRNNHNTPITATWNISSDLPDGTYTVRIETCEVNANNAGQNAQAVFPFEKNGTASTGNPTADSYLNVTLTYSGR